MSQQDILILAQQGDPRAIATLLNRSTQPHGITVKAARQHQDLFLLIEAAQVPDEASMVSLVHQAMVRLQVESVRTVKIFGRQTGNKTAIWNQDLKLPLLDESPEVAAIDDTRSTQSELFEHEAMETLDLGSAPELDTSLPDAPEVTAPSDDRDEFEAALDAELNTPAATSPEPATDDSEVALDAAIDEFEAALDTELNSPESTLPDLTLDDSDVALDSDINEFEAALDAATDQSDMILDPVLEPSDEPEPLLSADPQPLEPDEPLDSATDLLAPDESLPAITALTADSYPMDEVTAESELSLPAITEALAKLSEGIAPDETLDSLDAPDTAVDPAELSDSLEEWDETPFPDEESFPASLTASLELDATLETIGPDETMIYIEGPDPKPEEAGPAHLPSEQPLAAAAAEPVLPETTDYWADSPAPAPSISVPESISTWAEQQLTAGSVAPSEPHPEAEIVLADPVPATPASEFSREESEVQILLKKPEALAVLLVVLLVTLWDAYFQVLDEAEMTDGALSGRALSRRLGTSASTVRRRREQADFSAWTQTLDPDGIAWIYREDGKFVPRL